MKSGCLRSAIEGTQRSVKARLRCILNCGHVNAALLQSIDFPFAVNSHIRARFKRDKYFCIHILLPIPLIVIEEIKDERKTSRKVCESPLTSPLATK